ncbi:hypothetical protein [Salsipaludibacter albus]|uniref:hypothetical protein n=1 Tax=Salsipaludibacter albus TaxID=2849650 RepID=UPI001EE486BD|nr:hypothetical protein [Salsipaludibacter albus]MBY5161494.1 hypothetical protein [Salsipaludibacter albus]
MAFFPSGSHRWASHQSWWVRHSLSLVLVAILVVQTLAFHLSEVPDWVADQQVHGGSTALWPAYWLHFSAEWFVSVLADTYGALLLVLLTKWFYEQGSQESNDAGDD